MRVLPLDPRNNVDGLGDFLEVLSSERPWDILCLQEFTPLEHNFDSITNDGHQLFLTNPGLGHRRLATIVHRDFKGTVFPPSLVSRGIALPVDWEDLKLNVCNFHLDPYNDPTFTTKDWTTCTDLLINL